MTNNSAPPEDEDIDDDILAGLDFSNFDPDMLDFADETGVVVEDQKDATDTHSLAEEQAARASETLADHDIDAYPVHMAGLQGDSFDFTEAFLEAIAEEYHAKGCAVYECIWRFRFDANEEDVKRYSNAVRSVVSRLRKRAQSGDTSVISMLRFEILPDRKNVAINYARMTRPVWSKFQGAHLRLRNKQRVERDKKLMRYL